MPFLSIPHINSQQVLQRYKQTLSLHKNMPATISQSQNQRRLSSQSIHQYPLCLCRTSFVGRFVPAHSISYVSGCQRPFIKAGKAGGVGKTYRSRNHSRRPSAPLSSSPPPPRTSSRATHQTRKQKQKSKQHNEKQQRKPPLSLPNPPPLEA